MTLGLAIGFGMEGLLSPVTGDHEKEVTLPVAFNWVLPPGAITTSGPALNVGTTTVIVLMMVSEVELLEAINLTVKVPVEG